MSDLAVIQGTIPAMSEPALRQVRHLERMAAEMPQTPIATTHTFHAGMYARTVMVPAGVMITGALIKIPTMLIVNGRAIMYVDGQPTEIEGHAIFAASAGRKQALVAVADTYMTMLFPTDAKTVDEAERAFTDETDLLMSRHDDAENVVVREK